MRSILFAAATVFAIATLVPALGQQQRRVPSAAPGGKDSTQKAAKPSVTLGGKPLPVALSKRSFDSVANLRLIPVESGAVVTEFQFTYGEHKIYEDAAGNPTLMMDIVREYCSGDRINSNIREFLPAHTKGGDTAWFEGIYVRRKDGSVYEAQPLVFAIRR